MYMYSNNYYKYPINMCVILLTMRVLPNNSIMITYYYYDDDNIYYDYFDDNDADDNNDNAVAISISFNTMMT